MLRNGVTGGGATLRTGPERAVAAHEGRQEGSKAVAAGVENGGQRRSITRRGAALASSPPLSIPPIATRTAAAAAILHVCTRMYANPSKPPFALTRP